MIASFSVFQGYDNHNNYDYKVSNYKVSNYYKVFVKKSSNFQDKNLHILYVKSHIQNAEKKQEKFNVIIFTQLIKILIPYKIL